MVALRKGAVSYQRGTPVVLKLTNTDPFAAWFEVTGDATPDGIRVAWSVLGAISYLSIVAFRE